MSISSIQGPSSIPIFDRERGEIFEERVFGESELRFLYQGGGRPLVDAVLSRPSFSSFYGWLQRSPWSRRKIRKFVENFAIDQSEAEKNLDAYRSLDDFFTRKLRPSARPIDENAEHVVSPADGRVLVFCGEDEPRLAVKGHLVTIAELLNSEVLGQRFRRGSALVVRLAPADYHRFHFPADGIASAPQHIKGRLHSVHPLALFAGAPSFLNKRTVTYLDSERFGKLALVDVGALCVGTIVQTYAPGAVRCGAEKGFFRFGGSTVVVLFEEGRVLFDEDLVRHSRQGLETLVKMGTRIGCVVSSP